MTVQNLHSQEDPWQVAKIIGIKEGMLDGEAGAGDGFYSFLFSELVDSTRRIYANEIDKKLLEYINKQCSERNITNITTVKEKINDPPSPVDNLDIVFMRHVLQCMKKPEKLLDNLEKYMKTGALLVIIDGAPDIVRYGHDYVIKKEEVLKMAADAGFRLKKLEKIMLPEDYIYIFQKE